MMRYRAITEALVATLSDGAVLLNLQTKRYFSLNETGAIVWRRAQSACTIADLCEAIAETYSIDGQAAKADIEALVGRLVDAGLMHVMASDHV